MFLVDQMIMILLWTKPLHTKLDFGAISQKQQSTEPVSEVGHIILTPSQPVFVLFLYLILRAKQTLFCMFIYLYCHCRSNYQEGRGWWSHSSIYCLIHVCTSPKPGTGFPSTYVVVFFLQSFEKRCSCWYWWILIPSLFNFSFNKYQFYSVWFVPKENKIHDIPHLKCVP